MLLHDPNEVPKVQDLGFAVPPGQRSFVNVKATYFTNLEPPWGKCGDLPLTYNFTENTYTQFKCQMECLTDYADHMCQCRAPYMPENTLGLPEVCDIGTYLSCLVGSLGDLQQQWSYQQCASKCMPQCTKKSYEPIMSFGKMSELSVSDWLSNTGDTGRNLQDIYDTAINVQAKTNKYMYNSIYSKLSTLSASITAFREFADDWIIHESIFNKTLNIGSTFEDFIASDAAIVRKSQVDISLFTPDSNSGYSLEDVKGYLDAVNGHIYATILNISNVAFNDIVQYTDNMLVNYATHVSQTGIQTGCSESYGSVRYLLLQLSEFEQNPTDMAGIVAEYRTEKDKLLSCNQDFIDTANSIGTFNTSGNVDTIVNKYKEMMPDYRKIDVKIDVFTTQAEENIQKYFNDEETLLDTIDLLDDIIDPLKTELDVIKGVVLYDSVLATKNLVYDLKLDMKTEYTKIIDFMLEIQNYLSPSTEAFAYSELSIFLQPYLYFNQREYSLRFDPISMSDIPLERISYVKENFRTVMDAVIDNYFQQQLTVVDAFESLFISKITAVNAALADVEGLLTEYQTKRQIDKTFIENNFLTINVYYSELSYTSIEQQKALDEGSLMGEIGGFMGLFIGGSIMTLIEVFDLFIYNAFLKMKMKIQVGSDASFRKDNMTPVYIEDII
ncbi:unnamed protein product [Owenia fusiformis]|uniref:Uncharacterized protein n=1 Tax=Owenia fusiformis TaxID=6347 RepID=A0A8S4NP70_OWEFU|nr:unnamed protein product [Owenia fusiformis]